MSTAEAKSIPAPHSTGKLPNGLLGMLLFVITEIMTFAAFISAYLVVRSIAPEWPPTDQPRLPVEATAFNTFVLLLSGFFTFRANKAFFLPDQEIKACNLLLIAILLGSFFVLFQGYEWIGLIHFGLTMTSGPYGSFFYLIVGGHALHAVVAITILSIAYRKMKQGVLTPSEFWTGQAFWYFVVGLWPVLYWLVYLN
ncbi:MAG: heme-copper oxidase subunit III [Opitutales bacterium]